MQQMDLQGQLEAEESVIEHEGKRYTRIQIEGLRETGDEYLMDEQQNIYSLDFTHLFVSPLFSKPRFVPQLYVSILPRQPYCIVKSVLLYIPVPICAAHSFETRIAYEMVARRRENFESPYYERFDDWSELVFDIVPK